MAACVGGVRSLQLPVILSIADDKPIDIELNVSDSLNRR
jgi:hypothetical protein